MSLNKAALPEELSHEEVIALKGLDATLLELTTDDEADYIDTKMHA